MHACNLAGTTAGRDSPHRYVVVLVHAGMATHGFIVGRMCMHATLQARQQADRNLAEVSQAAGKAAAAWAEVKASESRGDAAGAAATAAEAVALQQQAAQCQAAAEAAAAQAQQQVLNFCRA